MRSFGWKCILSEGSTKFGFHEWFLDVLEAKPHVRLLKYDPSTKKTSILLTDLGFANGVPLFRNQDFLVICETWKQVNLQFLVNFAHDRMIRMTYNSDGFRFRCLRYWLKGESTGRTDIFIDNLPRVQPRSISQRMSPSVLLA